MFALFIMDLNCLLICKADKIFTVYGVSRAISHLGIALSIRCPSVSRTLHLLVPHAFIITSDKLLKNDSPESFSHVGIHKKKLA